VPLRPERVIEVRYDYLEGARFRHPPQFVRWREDREPESCGYAQLEQPAPFALADVLAGRLPGGPAIRSGDVPGAGLPG
jgi:ATP-dependent DNA ligase